MQWKNKSEMDERMGIMSVKGEDHQLSKITQENISATVKYAKSSLLRLIFQGFFPIFGCHMKLQSYFCDYIFFNAFK